MPVTNTINIDLYPEYLKFSRGVLSSGANNEFYIISFRKPVISEIIILKSTDFTSLDILAAYNKDPPFNYLII